MHALLPALGSCTGVGSALHSTTLVVTGGDGCAPAAVGAPVCVPVCVEALASEGPEETEETRVRRRCAEGLGARAA